MVAAKLQQAQCSLPVPSSHVANRARNRLDVTYSDLCFLLLLGSTATLSLSSSTWRN